MLEQIKKEKADFPDDVCTCECEVKEKVRSKVRQVLVNFGLSRKKVFTVNGKNEKLYEQFKNHILSEPAFSELLNDSYVVFQEFSEKFGTWVDIDVNEKLKDGTVLNAVFFPNNIERDELNPGCVKKKEILIVTENVKRKRSSHIIHVDLTDENENSVKKTKHSKQGKISKARMEEESNREASEEGNFKKNDKKVRSSLVNIDELKNGGGEEKEEGDLKNNENKSEKVRFYNVNKDEMKKEEDNIEKNKEQLKKKKVKILPEVNDKKTDDSKLKNMESSVKKEECVKTNKSSMKTNVLLTEESSQNGDESKPKDLQKISERKKHRNQEEANYSTRKRELNLTWPQQNVHHEMPTGSNCHYPETTDNFQASKKEWQRKNKNESARNLVENGISFVSEIYNMCATRNWPVPVFVTKEDPVNGFSCELKVKDITFFKVHSDFFKVKEAVAELAINRLKEKESCDNTYNTQYWGSWQRGSRRPFQRSPRRPFERSYRKSRRNE